MKVWNLYIEYTNNEGLTEHYDCGLFSEKSLGKAKKEFFDLILHRADPEKDKITISNTDENSYYAHWEYYDMDDYWEVKVTLELVDVISNRIKYDKSAEEMQKDINFLRDCFKKEEGDDDE